MDLLGEALPARAVAQASASPQLTAENLSAGGTDFSLTAIAVDHEDGKVPGVLDFDGLNVPVCGSLSEDQKLYAIIADKYPYSWAGVESLGLGGEFNRRPSALAGLHVVDGGLGHRVVVMAQGRIAHVLTPARDAQGKSKHDGH